MKTEPRTGRTAETGIHSLLTTSNHFQPLTGSRIATGGVYAESRLVAPQGGISGSPVRRVVGSDKEDVMSEKATTPRPSVLDLTMGRKNKLAWLRRNGISGPKCQRCGDSVDAGHVICADCEREE